MSADLQNRFNELIAAVFNMDVSEIRDDRGPHDIEINPHRSRLPAHTLRGGT